MPSADRNRDQRGDARHEQHGDRAPEWSARLGRLCKRWLADRERISADSLFDVLELGRAEVGHIHVEPAAHLTIRVFGQTDRSGLCDPLEPRGDVDAVAHEVAVALLDDVAHVNTDTKVDALLGREASVALDESGLYFDRAAHRVNHAAELDDRAVARALNDASVVHGDDRVDQVAAE